MAAVLCSTLEKLELKMVGVGHNSMEERLDEFNGQLARRLLALEAAGGVAGEGEGKGEGKGQGMREGSVHAHVARVAGSAAGSSAA